MNESILLVEDQESLRTTLGDRLRSEGYVVDTAADGLEGLDKAAKLTFDLIILDIMLPLRSGLDVCTDLRKAGIAAPILMLTVRNETVDKVVGFKLGADDYVTKPFEAAELMARIEALLRRAPLRKGPGLYEFGAISVNLRGEQVTRAGEPVDLTEREFQLLRHLLEHTGSTISREELLRCVWGYDIENTSTRTVDTHICSLRQKLEEDPSRPTFIVTVSGVGYRFRTGR